MRILFKFLLIIIILVTAISITGCKKEDNINSETGFNKKYKEENYNLDTKNGTIYGSLMIPEKLENETVALIIAGSGPTDRNGNNPGIPGENNSLKMVAEALAKEKIASVRYDKRGIGESASLIEKEEELVFEDYIEDVIDWIEKLEEDNRFSNIIIIGHSEGALIGAVAASNVNVQGYVSLAGMGFSAYDTLVRQLSDQPGDIAKRSQPILDELKNGNLVEDIDKDLEALFRPSVQPYMISWLKYDPAEEIKKIKAPILIVQGKNDLQVTIEDAERLHKGNPEAKLVLIEKMNHILKDAPKSKNRNFATYSKPDLPLNEELVKELIEFINNLL